MKLTPEDLKEILDAVPVDEVGGEREYSVFSNYLYKFANTPAQWFLTKETHKPLDCAQLERSMYMSESLQLIVALKNYIDCRGTSGSFYGIRN